MLPMLVYPIMIPCLLAAIQLSAALIAGKPIEGDLQLWLRLVIGFDVIYTALASILVDTVLLG
jgi:heme exporter protein B